MPNILTDDKAPFVLALLISAFTWHSGQLVSEIKEADIVSYSLETDEAANSFALTVQNMSDSKTYERLRLSLVCPNGSSCINERSYRPRADDTVYIIPVCPDAVDDCIYPYGAEMIITLTPRATAYYEAKRRPGMEFPTFRYTPLHEGGDRPNEDVVVMKTQSLFVWALWLYPRYLIGGLITICIIFTLYLRHFLQPPKVPPQSS